MGLELEGVRRLVERDPGPERARAARPGPGPSGGCSPRRTGAGPASISADSSARSYWPRTFEPMNPSRNPSWRVVTQRLARAIVALPSPPPGGMTWSSSSSSSVADQRRERRDVRPDPAGPVDDARTLDDAGQLRAERLATGAGTIRAIAAAYSGSAARSSSGVSVPGAARGGRSRSARPATSRRGPRRAASSARRPRTVAAAPSAEPTRNPACQSAVVAPGLLRGSALRGATRRGRSPGRPTGASSTRVDVEERVAEQPPGDRPERVDVAGRELDVARRRRRPARRLEAVDRQQLRRAPTPSPSPSRRSSPPRRRPPR